MSQVWTIALGTIRMTTRRWLGLGLVVLVALGGALLASFVEGDGTLLGLLKVELGWSLGFASAFLMLLLLYLASTALDAEIVGGQITLLAVRPIARWQIVVGKWLGVSVLAGGILLGIGLLTYAHLRWTAAHPPPTANAENGAAVGEDGGPAAVQAQFLVSRRSHHPRLRDPDGLVDLAASQLVERGGLEAESAANPEVRSWLRSTFAQRLPPIAPGGSLALVFSDIDTSSQRRGDIALRYRIYGRRGLVPQRSLAHSWRVAGTAGPVVIPMPEAAAGVTHEVTIDRGLIGPDGRLELELLSDEPPGEDEPGTRLVVPGLDSVELLDPTGSFAGNFARALLLLWIRLVLIAGVGVGASTFLRGSVTGFLLLGLLLVGTLGGFVRNIVLDSTPPPQAHQHGPNCSHEHEDEPGHTHDAERSTGPFARFWREDAAPILFAALPDFAETDPVPDLLAGREIGWRRLGFQASVDVLLRAGAFLLLGVWHLRRREIGLPRVE